jgi:hypothetical protein
MMRVSYVDQRAFVIIREIVMTQHNYDQDYLGLPVFNEIANVYSLEYTKFPNVFFTLPL